VDAEAARKMPGVLAVYTGADLAAYGPHKCMLDFKQRDGSPMKRPIRRSLASGKVRFEGDPVACVVADSAARAKGRGGGGGARHRAAAGRGARERGGRT
jgi:carbon-monoxide dehydrogenase large subunit